MSQIIDGTKLAFEKEKLLRERLQKLDKTPKVVSILIGEDPASVMYTNMKQKKAQELGINFEPLRLPVETDFEEVMDKIQKMNSDPEITGIMIQLPLSKEFLGEHKTNELLELIDSKKDIDGLNPIGSDFIPATVKGVLSILNSVIHPHPFPPPSRGRVRERGLNELVFAVVGSEGEVGASLVFELTNRGATVIKVDKKLPETSLNDIKNADVVIGTTGVKGLITADLVKDGVIVIDVTLGEFNEDVYRKASFYTPKFGGVGPMTIISLMENILEASEK